MGKIIAICMSEKKGTQKHEIDHAIVKEDWGIVGDAHAGNCHSHCEIYKVMGDCIMPREGVFAKVIRGGEIHTGDEITLLPI